MLSGEGNSVIGSKNSMNPNSYRKVFNSATSEGVDEAYQNDESNLWYIYDKTDGRLKQKMIDNLDEPKARSMGYRDSIEGALRVANIMRSKFDPKKYVQKQGNQWVPVYPFGKPQATEAFSSPPPFKDMIASIYRPKVGDKIRTRKGGQIPGTVEKVADHNGIEYCWFRHPEGKLYKTPCSNVMRG
jgi:hypothetical protein